MQNIILIAYGHFELNSLKEIAGAITREYSSPVVIKEGYMDMDRFFDASRRQYDGNKILKEVDFVHHFEALKKIALFKVDLYIPILTYIFGQAYLNGKTGIASLYRLKNELYGMNSDENLLVERFIKEVIHELGHTFGLKHCYNPSCVMRSSTYVEDIDQKSSFLCNRCKKLLI
ncbi:MAG: archaemetzincin family Zn-dependent metalloprotease [Chlorobi bacterium]|nr:archaemetzincin family Zn-dependent metalloprotease [Chlorobiota bacterium]